MKKLPVPPAPGFTKKLWVSLEPSLLILLKDIALFLIVLAALIVGFAGIAGLKAMGMRPERAEMVETVHFYGYIAVMVVFLFDMVVKLLMEAWKARS